MPTNSPDESSRFRGCQFPLRAILLLVTVAGLCLGGYVHWSKIDFKFDEYDDYYLVWMSGTVPFQGSDCSIAVVLEDGRTTPTIRQRWLIYNLQNYSPDLSNAIDVAADENRIEFEGLVGDLTKEYGLPVMNLQNIRQHYDIGLIKIPRLTGSPDDYIVLSCSCTWEDEHGMEMLIKNGTTVEWHGEEGPWQWEKAWEFCTKR